MKKKFTKTNDNGDDRSASFLNRSITSQSPSPKKPMTTKLTETNKNSEDTEDVVLMDENDENAAPAETKPKKSKSKST
jgi:hypothetical protein